jgi:hypothetical protein
MILTFAEIEFLLRSQPAAGVPVRELLELGPEQEADAAARAGVSSLLARELCSVSGEQIEPTDELAAVTAGITGVRFATHRPGPSKTLSSKNRRPRRFVGGCVAFSRSERATRQDHVKIACVILVTFGDCPPKALAPTLNRAFPCIESRLDRLRSPAQRLSRRSAPNASWLAARWLRNVDHEVSTLLNRFTRGANLVINISGHRNPSTGRHCE